jgi:hypothetical protein
VKKVVFEQDDWVTWFDGSVEHRCPSGRTNWVSKCAESCDGPLGCGAPVPDAVKNVRRGTKFYRPFDPWPPEEAEQND